MNRLARLCARALVVALAAASLPTQAIPAGQQAVKPPAAVLQPVVVQASDFAVSPAVRSLPPATTVDPRDRNPDPPGKRRNPPVRPIVAPRPEGFQDPLIEPGRRAPNAMPPVITSFEGVSAANDQSILGAAIVPPDTNGDVGRTQYVQSVNSLLQIWDKNGTSQVGPIPLSSLWSSGTCSTSDDGDPIVLYDHLANRWLLSQFALPNYPSGPFYQCIAISQTPDATGAYWLYEFVMPGTGILNDYPHFGVWPSAYLMMDHQFVMPAGTWGGSGAFAFDRAQMLLGNPTASYIYFDLNLLNPAIGGLLPADLDGPAPPAGTPGYFAYPLSTVWGDPMDGVRVYEFQPDWVTPTSSTFSLHGDVAVAAWDPDMCGYARNCIPQPPAVPPAAGTSQPVDAISDRFMHRLAYRTFGTHAAMVVAHTVDAGGDHAAVRWYELRRPLSPTPGPFALYDQGTQAPDTTHRWLGSAAIDSVGNLAVGYNASNATTVFPSIYYAGRLGTDPPGSGLAQGESTAIAGSNSQTTSAYRWGDYSAMSTDPVDECTFWYTQEYYTSSPPACSVSNYRCWQTRIVSFRFPSCNLIFRDGFGSGDATAWSSSAS